ncbi:hypothetical protein CAEBREN_07175 [Caenorhabditis brenneri]|uniref:Uncharacterized protein n=1 Tax=Caenorhabditis brenneri TaxID=135651 RepID=G0PHT8_CAEBE|nr:hypothetical protein CAEBREN_07175 [Caenorhabditis brenneri]
MDAEDKLVQPVTETTSAPPGAPSKVIYSSEPSSPGDLAQEKAAVTDATPATKAIADESEKVAAGVEGLTRGLEGRQPPQ